MTKPIIYSNFEFREEFIQKINEIAPDYTYKHQMSGSDYQNVAISIGWDKQLANDLLAESQLKWVQSISAGVDSLPLKQYHEKQILLSNSSGLHATAISEHVTGVILAYYRGLIPAINAQQQHKWLNHDGLFYDQLAGKKMLVVGTGQIGKHLAKTIKSLGVEIYGINTGGHSEPDFIETYAVKNLHKIVEEMDIVVNILPLTDSTKGMYDLDFFKAMKTSAMFINVGRGPSVNEKNLYHALNEQLIAFAALDVFENEPLAQDSPLWQLDNLLITPHISGMSAHFQIKFMKIFLANLKSFVENETLVVNQVDLAKGY